ncbi:PAS domain-containing sensor histidine kinase [Pseudomonas lundensis]|uniref:histidine kinase n=1 Tax=Pseudomonas lundensis TaxID=86185 RepID=A0ABX4GRA4_9PSED|nr:PAS domain S-box protein [Pseudomonas lundensis]NMZ53179.1 PAS domain S-box protein [Pseudomonas lundensis]OZY28611.1 PAS domain-containing sensor histidine kinase [Pseudomonas lundensis]OZY56622.1 PAS domain-containing sensor histidine kinase [Pseudomonas lundensis]QOF91442.1 PAS domain S-box protein [Pseudomonas lundensis]
MPATLMHHDPHPSVILDAEGAPLRVNPALEVVLAGATREQVRAWLPGNLPELVRACLQQQRAIEHVEAQYQDQVWLWTLIPDVDGQWVLARGREASQEWMAEREAAKARRLYRLITENTTDLISRHTPDGRFLDASPASWTLLGYWPQSLRGTRAQRLFHPDDWSEVIHRARDALHVDGYYTMTYRIRHQCGHYLWFETASRAIRETYTGAVVEVVSVSRDITARVQAEENKRRLAEVVEANPDPVLFIDPQGGVSYLNPAARRILGLAPSAGMPALSAFLSREDVAQLDAIGWGRAEQQGLWSTETRLLPLNDQPSVPVSLLLLAHRSTAGERFFSLVARDMRERELREAQQRQHQDEMAHTARLVTLGELASGIAHEINQPLAAVVNYANASQRYLHSLSSNPQAVDRVAQGLERITLHANHAAEVITRLRSFLRKGRRNVQALDVSEVMRRAVSLCAWEANARRVTIEQEIPAHLPRVFADQVLLEQVLLNLLRNAIEANGEKRPAEPSRIRLQAQALGNSRLQISVLDEGPGVSQAQLHQLFTPFYTSKADGLGLGLSMSRSIIEGLGGELEAHPQPHGLLMCCTLPLMGAAHPPEQQQESD